MEAMNKVDKITDLVNLFMRRIHSAIITNHFALSTDEEDGDLAFH